VHIRLPLRLSTALSDPVFVDARKSSLYATIIPPTNTCFILHRSYSVLSVYRYAFARTEETRLTTTLVGQTSRKRVISEAEPICVILRIVRDPGMYLTIATLVEPFQIKVDPVAIAKGGTHTSSRKTSLRNTPQSTPKQQISTPKGIPADQLKAALSSTSTERLLEPPPSIQERPHVYMVFLYLSSINL
jgi:hypothetical protein